MGAVQSTLKKSFLDMFSAFQGRKKASLTILGLDSAGKTSLVCLFKGETDKITVATMGLNIDTIVFRNTTIKVYDLGGQEAFRVYWKSYVSTVDGLIFMIDVNDNEKGLNAAYKEFSLLMEVIKDRTPILLFLNKMDLLKENKEEKINKIIDIFNIKTKNGFSEAEISSNGKTFSVNICNVSVLNDIKMLETDGTATIQQTSVYSGFKWMIDSVNSDKPV